MSILSDVLRRPFGSPMGSLFSMDGSDGSCGTPAILDLLGSYCSTSDYLFVLRMERYEDTDSGWPGWYWTATIEFSDPNREPTNYAIGIYDSEWRYLYTTGKFYLKDTGETDEDGEPIMKYVTSCPPGYQTAEPEDIHFAMLLGSGQRGRMVLAAESDSIQRYFWEQGSGA